MMLMDPPFRAVAHAELECRPHPAAAPLQFGPKMQLFLRNLSASAAAVAHDLGHDTHETMVASRRSLAVDELCQQLGEVNADDLGLGGDARWRDALDRERCAISYVQLYEDSYISVGLFLMPRGSSIPLHDHPGMSVVSKVVEGRIHVRSYDFLDGSVADRPYRGHLQASLRADEVLGRADPAHILLPKWKNLHEIQALEDSAVLDILAPPYSDARDCTYFRMDQRTSLASCVLSPFETPPP
eukprot:tig00000194_g14768.t1